MGDIRPLKQGSQGSHETPSEKKVQDITINAFYEPHTLTFLAMIAVSTVLNRNLASATCLQKTDWRTGFLIMSSKSWQVSFDSLFPGPYFRQEKNRIKTQKTRPVTGFPAEQGLACSVLKPVRDSVSCLLTLFCRAVCKTALKTPV